MGVSGSIRSKGVAVVSGVRTGLGTLTLGMGVRGRARSRRVAIFKKNRTGLVTLTLGTWMVGRARSRGGAVLMVKAAEDIAVGHGRRQ